MSRLGAIAAAPFLGGQFVSLYRGATRVPTVPGMPSWAGEIPASGGDEFEYTALPPENDGGSEITAYRVYVNGTLEYSGLFLFNGEYLVDAGDISLGTSEIAVAAVNAVGEGPRLTAIYEYVED